jgi:hypothetical protein
VQEQTAQLVGKAFGFVRALDQRLDVYLVLDESADTSSTFRAYSEMWGTSATNGSLTPVAWASSMVEAQRVFGALVVKLEVDLRWLKKAGVKAPYTLQNVYLQDSLTFVPVTTMPSIPLSVVNQDDLRLEDLEYDGVTITREMRQGIMPAHIANASADDSEPRLVMVHGYGEVEKGRKKLRDFFFMLFVSPLSFLSLRSHAATARRATRGTPPATSGRPMRCTSPTRARRGRTTRLRRWCSISSRRMT